MPSRPADLTRADVERYIRWLKGKYPNGSTAKNYYSAFKSVIVGLIDYGFIENSPEIMLPANPFPMNGSATRGELPLSPTEMQRLATALKSDLVAIHHQRFCGLESEATVVLLLLIGMRSGINATPLLEMKRDCLSPHPFMPNLLLVRTFKRRGKGAQSTTLRQTDIRDQASPIPMDGVAILRRALEMTEELAANAPNAICTSGVDTLGMNRLRNEDSTTAAMMHRINSNTANVPPLRVFPTFSSLPRGGYERVSPWADVRAASVGRAGRACRSDVRTSRAERSYGRRYTVAYAMGR